MMRRCKHPNVIIVELLDATSTWFFDGGKLADDGCSEGLLNGRIEVSCQDCGYLRCFGRLSKRPKWVDTLMDVIADRHQGG